MGFLFQLPDWFVEHVGVAPLTIFCRKRYSYRGPLQASRHTPNSQMKMQREGGFRTTAAGNLMLRILGAVQPNDCDARILKDAAGLAFRVFYGFRRNRRRVENRHPQLHQIAMFICCSERRRPEQSHAQGPRCSESERFHGGTLHAPEVAGGSQVPQCRTYKTKPKWTSRSKPRALSGLRCRVTRGADL